MLVNGKLRFTLTYKQQQQQQKNPYHDECMHMIDIIIMMLGNRELAVIIIIINPWADPEYFYNAIPVHGGWLASISCLL